MLTNGGPYVREFEQRVAELVGVRHCIATCNGTLALEIAIRALGLSGEVIVPAFTFVATAHALQWQEITPVFCDIDPETCNLDPARVEALITPRTSGIIGVHLWGRPCDTQALVEIARERGLRLLYDASHAFGCSHRGRMIGSFGDAEVFSFHATKFVNTFEGGAILTKSDELAKKARLMRNFGFVDYDRVVHVGTNGKMNELSAAMGLTSLEAMPRFIEVNRANYNRYREGLAALPGLRVLPYDERDSCNYQYIVVDVDEAEAGVDRDQLVKILHAEGILARRYFHPGCHRMLEPYGSYFPHAAGLLLPVTDRKTTQVFTTDRHGRRRCGHRKDLPDHLRRRPVQVPRSFGCSGNAAAPAGPPRTGPKSRERSSQLVIGPARAGLRPLEVFRFAVSSPEPPDRSSAVAGLRRWRSTSRSARPPCL